MGWLPNPVYHHQQVGMPNPERMQVSDDTTKTSEAADDKKATDGDAQKQAPIKGGRKADEPKDASTPTPSGDGEEPKFPRERLISEASKFFDQPPYVLAGALAESKKELTRDEAEAAIKKFLSGARER